MPAGRKIAMCKLRCRSAGSVWPEILYTVPEDVERILAWLEAKTPLDGGAQAELRCGGKEIAVTLPGTEAETHWVYMGYIPDEAGEICIVRQGDHFYRADVALFSLLDLIATGSSVG